MTEPESDVLGSLSAYELSYLVEHLVGAGRGQDVHRLLQLPGLGRPAWYEAKTRNDDERGYERDLAVARQLADEEFRRATREEEQATAVGLQTRYALVHASLRALAADLTPALLAALVRTKQWTVSAGLVAAARVADPDVRARLFAELAAVAGAEDRSRIVTEALGLEDGSRASTLVTIAGNLPPRALVVVPAAARALGDDQTSADALVAVAPRIPEPQVRTCLEDARSICDRQARVRALVGLAGRLSPELADEVVLDDAALLDEGSALDVVASVAPSLTEEGARQAVVVLRRFRPSARRAGVVAAVLHALPARRRGEVREAERQVARAIRAQGERATALALLGYDAEALDVALAVPAARKAAAVVAVAPLLTPTVARRALDAAGELPTANARSEVLVSLAPVLDPAAMLGALKLVEEVPGPKARAAMIAALAPRLPGPRVGRAVRLALEIKDVDARAVALGALQPRMEDRHRTTGLFRRRGHVSYPLEPAAEPGDGAPAPGPEPAADSGQLPQIDDEAAAARALRALVAARGGGQQPGCPGQALADEARERLLRLALQDSAHRAALLHWVKKVSPDSGPGAAWITGQLTSVTDDLDLAPELADHGADNGDGNGDRNGDRNGDGDPRLLQDAALRAIDEWAVDLRDPAMVRALPVLDDNGRRTALHIALALAERNERDDELVQEEPEVADLAPAFAQSGRIHELVEAGGDLVGPYRRAEALVGVLPHLPRQQGAEVAAVAASCVAEAVRRHSPRMWARRFGVVGRLAPMLDGRRLQRLAAALTKAERGNVTRAPSVEARRLIVNEARLALVPHTAARLRTALCHDILASAAELRVATLRRATLEALVPWLTAAVIEQAGDVARSFEDTTDRAAALGAVARRSAELGLDGTAADLVSDIGRLPGALGDLRVLTVLACHVDLLRPVDLSAIWCPGPGHGVLWQETGSRAELLDALAILAPAVARLGGPTGLDAVEDDVRLVRRWWP